MSVGTGDRVTRVYRDFRGVDFRTEECALNRSPDACNLLWDYRGGEGVRTRPGLAPLAAFDETVYGIFFFRGETLVHSGDTLYRLAPDGGRTALYTGLRLAPSRAFSFENRWYGKDGEHYLVYDGETVQEVEGYVPTTSLARKPAGGGATHEDVNMLTPRRVNSFLADGLSVDYHLDAQNLDRDFAPIVRVGGAVVSNYTVDYAAGLIRFAAAPAAPLAAGQDNVTVEFAKTVPGYRESILRCTLLQVFDNRMFFSGNPDYPNVVWHGSLYEPGYVSDLDFYREGLDGAAVRGLVAGNNALWVFREPSAEGTALFYHTPALDSEYGKIYPAVHSSVTTGCVGGAVNFGDDIVFFSPRGMEGVSGDVTTEQALSHRSSLVDRKLLCESGYRDMLLAEWEGYLVVFTGDHAYLADSRRLHQHEGRMEYEWYYWELPEAVTAAAVHSGTLYLGTASGVYTLTDETAAVKSWWTTPKDRFGAPNQWKTSHKRGCVVEGTGDFTLAAKTEGTAFEPVIACAAVGDYAVPRIRRKKWKELQLRLQSDMRFALQQVTLESFIGGYIKR